MYKEVQKMIGCTAKTMSNVLKEQPKAERPGMKWKITTQMEEE